MSDKRLRRMRFDAAAKARRVADLESAIRGMQETVSALSQLVASEEWRTRVSNPNHFTYSTAAKAATERAHRLKKSIADLEAQLHAARLERDSAMADLAALQSATSATTSVSPRGSPTEAALSLAR